MRVLLVSNLYPPCFIGGYEIGASWVARCLRAQGHQVCVLTASQIFIGKGDKCDHLIHTTTPPDADAWLDAGACFYGVDVLDGLIFRRASPAFEAARVALERHFREYSERKARRAKGILDFSPDIILTFNPACLLDPVLAEITESRALKGIPIFAYVSDDWLISWSRSNPLIFLWRYYQDHRDNHGHLSEEGRRLVADCHRWEQQGIFSFLCEPTAHHRFFTSRSLQIRYEREKPECAEGTVVPWGLPDIAAYPVLPPERLTGSDPLTLVYAGQTEPHKGLYDLLVALLRTQRPHRLLIMGDPLSQHAQFCQEFVRHSPLEGRVSFLGKLPTHDVWARAVKEAEVYVLPSRFLPGVFQEPFSIGLLQAMASGLAIIASDSGGSPEAIQTGHNGLVHQANNADSLVAMLDRMEMARDEAQKMAKQARLDAVEGYSIETMTAKMLVEINRLVSAPTETTATLPSQRARVFYLLHNANRDPANSGCVRVARRLGKELQSEIRPWFVRWRPETEALTFLDIDGADYLSRFNGPERVDVEEPGRCESFDLPVHQSIAAGPLIAGGWLFLPELLDAAMLRQVFRYARVHRMRCAAIFYDAIPLLRPELCNDEIRANHAAYMDELAQCDLVIPISRFSSECLLQHWRDRSIPAPEVVPILLAGEFKCDLKPSKPKATSVASILCVSTVEPRKNHRTLLAAFDLARKQAPDLTLTLDLVGNAYAGAPELTQMVEEACRKHPEIVWHRIVDDRRLAELYQQASFTVYPSVIEGYGLPIVESVWHQRPCICSDGGVMAELAAEGGVLTVDVEDPEALAAAILKLARRDEVYQQLAIEASARILKTWRRYGNEVAAALDLGGLQAKPTAARAQETLEDLLFPGCFVGSANWPLGSAARAGLSLVLHRLQPRVIVEIDTQGGGSLALARQFAPVLFSLNRTPAPATLIQQMDNVSFFAFDSASLVGAFAIEMRRQEVAVNLLLVNGNPWPGSLLDLVSPFVESAPTDTLLVLLPRMANDNLREDLRLSPLLRCNYLHRVDLDFIPPTGREAATTSERAGQGWALLLFQPAPRRGLPPSL